MTLGEDSASTSRFAVPSEVVAKGEPLFEIHAQSEAQLEFGRAYAEAHLAIVRFGF
jgi:thymidine phosphorylase